MNQIVSSQVQLFITSIQIGILLGILFDLIRIARKIIKHPNFLVQIEDMLYWIISGFIGFYILYRCNYANIRPFIFIGMLLGATLYFLTFSIVFMKITTIMIDFIKRILRKCYALLLIPIKAIVGAIKIPLVYIKHQIRKAYYHQKIHLRALKRKHYFKVADKKVDTYLKKSKI